MKKLIGLIAFSIACLLSAQVAPGVGSPGASAGGNPSSGPGSGTVQSVSVIPTSTITGSVANATTNPAITLNAIGVTPPASGNALISGSGIGFISGLQFTVGAEVYLIQGTQYSSPQTTLTAAAADPSNPRIDVVAFNTSGVPVIIQGTPSATPAKPTVDPATQVELTFYTVDSGASSISVSTNDIYHENTEWATSKVGAPINLASTNNPHRGTVDIELTAAVSGNSFTFTSPSDLDIGTFDSLVFYVAPKSSFPNAKQFSVQWLSNTNAAVGGIVTFKSGTFGFNSGGTANAYQLVTIPTSLFGANGQTTARKLKFSLIGGGGSIGAYFDDFTLQGGLAPSQASGDWMLWRGTYTSNLPYNLNDVVSVNNIEYVCIQAVPAGPPAHPPATSPTYWQVVVDASNSGVASVLGTANEVGVNTVGNVATVFLPNALTFTGKTVTGGTYSGALLSGITTQSGTTVTNSAAMGALVIDVAQRINTKTVGADTAFTFSGTPATGQWFGLEVTNSDTAAHTLTIPSSFLVNATPGGVTTTQTLPASGKLYLNWRYDGTTYNLYAGGGGAPGGSSGDYQYNNAGAFGGRTPGTGVNTAFQNATNAAGGFVTFSGALGTPTSGTLTNATGLPLTSGVTGLLPIANGGTATATPGLVQGSNITITGTWPNQTIAAAGGGSGTVTSASVVTANGVSATVANPTTTPAFTFTLGAITPTTVNGNTLTTGSSTYTGTAGQTYTMPATSATMFGSTTKADVLEAATFATDAAGTDSYVITLSPAITSYVTNAAYRFIAGTANTGAATININGLGAKTIKKAAGGLTTDLADNDIRAGQPVDLVYDGTNMQMQSTLGNTGAGGSPAGSSGQFQFNNAGSFGATANLRQISGRILVGNGADDGLDALQVNGWCVFPAGFGIAFDSYGSYVAGTAGSVDLKTFGVSQTITFDLSSTTTPNPFLFTPGSTTGVGLRLRNTNVTTGNQQSLFEAGFSDTRRITLGAAGDTVSAPYAAKNYLQSSCATGEFAFVTTLAGASGTLEVYTRSGPTETARFSPSGNLLVGTTSETGLTANGNISASANIVAGSPSLTDVQTTGAIASATAFHRYTGWASGAPYGVVEEIVGNNVNDDNWAHLAIFDSTTTTGHGGRIMFGTGSDSGNTQPLCGIRGVSEGTGFGSLVFMTRPSGGTNTERGRFDSTGQFLVQTVGKSISVKSGTNAKAGSVTLSSGAGTISTTAVTANSVLHIGLKPGGASGTITQQPYATAATVGSGYTIAGSATDNSTYNWWIEENN